MDVLAAARPPARPPSRLARAALSLAALAAAPLPWLAWNEWHGAQDRLARRAAEHAVALPPAITAEVRREPDPARGAVVLARAFLAAELDPRTAAAPRPEGRARLAAARELAASALAVRPAAWDAAMVLGGATYLGWAQARDPRLLTRYERWEEPLLGALALAPGRREAGRFLAAAYLELWPAVSPEKRGLARRLLASAFRDPETFRRLIGAWLDVAPSRAAAFALVPPEPPAWEAVQGLYAGRGDWRGASAAHRRWRQAMRVRLEADLRAGQERLAGGDPVGARSHLLGVAAHAEASPAGAALLARALAICPAGPVDTGTAARLAAQLAWVVDRCQVAACPLPERELRRLAGLCRGLPSEEAALAALAAIAGGDLAEAEQVERRAAAQWSEAWAPYLIAKARLLAARGRAAEASATLGQVHRLGQETPLYRLARREAAQAAGDQAAIAEAERGLAALAAAEWPATAWSWRGGRVRLVLLAARPAPGTRIAVDDGPAGGAWVELRWDGAYAGRAAAVPGAELALAVPVSPGVHFLDVTTVAGGTVYPGRVRLAPTPGTGPGATIPER